MKVLSDILGFVMYYCYSPVRNYGVAIILFTLISKIVLLPISIWVQKNSIKMVKMQPEINRIKARFFGDKDRIADEQTSLFKKEKYNPLASMIPLIAQIVLLLGVVAVIYHPMNYLLRMPEEGIDKFIEVAVANDKDNKLDPTASSIQLSVVEQIQSGEYDETFRNVKFENSDINASQMVDQVKGLKLKFLGFDLSWITSVRMGMSIWVPIIAGFSAWLLCIAQNSINVLQAEQSNWNKYGMMVLSVGLSVYLGCFVPAGTALYWVASNLFAILQQYLLNIWINPKKYIDYEALEESRKELADMMNYGGKSKKKFSLKADPNAKREKEDYKRFFSIAGKHLVFYSENNGFYKYYSKTIDYILKYSNIPIHYITSDPDDKIFDMAKENGRIHAYYIGAIKLITLMMKMDADVVVMTMPDIENYQIKRSIVRKDIEYIYIPHGMDSLNMTMRTGSMDHYDSVLVAGKHQREEIEKTELAYDLPRKIIVDCGYPLLDQMIEERDEKVKESGKKDKKTVLIAPSWQKDNIVDSCLTELLDQLKTMDINVVVRPHPQHVRHMPEKMEALKEKYADNKNIEIQTDFSSNSTVFEADLMITDWSGITYEYAFTTLRPVLFMDTPMKVMNPEYTKIDTEPINIWMRKVIGQVVKTDEIETIPQVVSQMLDSADSYKEKISGFIEEYVYNLGNSGEVSGRYVISAVQRKIKEKASQEKSA